MRGARSRLASLVLIPGAALLLAGCQTGAPSKAQYEAQGAELEKARQEAAEAQDKLAQSETDNATLWQTVESQNQRLRNQENRSKELESTNGKLQALLNDLQVLQLGSVVNTAGVPVQNLQNSDTPVNGDGQPAESRTLGPDEIGGHPADTTPEAQALSPAASEAVSAADAASLEPPPGAVPAENPLGPIPALSAASDIPVAPGGPEPVEPATELSAAAPVPVKAVRLPPGGGGLGHDVFNRVERKALRGTLMFDERDSASGIHYLYHRQAWYDKAGVFVEFSKAGQGTYQSRLVVQLPDPNAETPGEAPLPADASGGGLQILLAGQELGPVANTRTLDDNGKRYRYASLILDDAMVARIRLAMQQGGLILAVRHADGSAGPDYMPDLAMRSALKDMFEARNDLK